MKNLLLVFIFCVVFFTSAFAQTSTTVVPVPIMIPLNSEATAYYFDEVNVIHEGYVSTYQNSENITKIVIDGKAVFVHNKSTLTEQQMKDMVNNLQKEEILFGLAVLCAVVLFFVLLIMFLKWKDLM